MKKVTVLLFAIIAVGLTACGNNNTTAQNALGGYYDANGNYVQTGTNFSNGSCIPLQSFVSPVPISAQGSSINSAVILAGLLPQNSTRPGQYGQVMMGAGMNNFMGGYGMLSLVKQSVSGTLQIQLANTQGFTGAISFSQTVLTSIMMSAASNQIQPYPMNNFNMYNSNICVNSIAIDAVYSTNGYGGAITQALVYVYLNNSSQPIMIPYY